MSAYVQERATALVGRIDGPVMRLLERSILDRIADLAQGLPETYVGEERSLRDMREVVHDAINMMIERCLRRDTGPIREIHDGAIKAGQSCPACGENTTVRCCARHFGCAT